MKVLLTGVSGQLGHDAAKVLTARGVPFLGLSSRELDIADRDAVLRIIREYRPDAVLHGAAYTQVDRAEDDGERCMRVNADGTRHIAEGCRELGAKPLYVSTDYVFPGTGDRLGHDRRYGIDPSKIKADLGWYPETPFEIGIVKTIDWYLENPDWVEHVSSGEYQRYYAEMYGGKMP